MQTLITNCPAQSLISTSLKNRPSLGSAAAQNLQTASELLFDFSLKSMCSYHLEIDRASCSYWSVQGPRDGANSQQG